MFFVLAIWFLVPIEVEKNKNEKAMWAWENEIVKIFWAYTTKKKPKAFLLPNLW